MQVLLSQKVTCTSWIDALQLLHWRITARSAGLQNILCEFRHLYLIWCRFIIARAHPLSKHANNRHHPLHISYLQQNLLQCINGVQVRVLLRAGMHVSQPGMSCASQAMSGEGIIVEAHCIYASSVKTMHTCLALFYIFFIDAQQ